MDLEERGKGKENEGASVILKNIRWEGRGYKDVNLTLLKNGRRKVEGQGRVMKRVVSTKIKYTHNGCTLRYPFEHQAKY
jgi:hypothetical protein